MQEGAGRLGQKTGDPGKLSGLSLTVANVASCHTSGMLDRQDLTFLSSPRVWRGSPSPVFLAAQPLLGGAKWKFLVGAQGRETEIGSWKTFRGECGLSYSVMSFSGTLMNTLPRSFPIAPERSHLFRMRLTVNKPTSDRLPSCSFVISTSAPPG